jgi:hypothetical protein
MLKKTLIVLCSALLLSCATANVETPPPAPAPEIKPYVYTPPAPVAPAEEIKEADLPAEKPSTTAIAPKLAPKPAPEMEEEKPRNQKSGKNWSYEELYEMEHQQYQDQQGVQ